MNGAEMKICVTCEKPLESHPTEKSVKKQSENLMSTAGNTVRVIDKFCDLSVSIFMLYFPVIKDN